MVRCLSGLCGSTALVVLLVSTPSWAATPFADFFIEQKIGQELTMTGAFFRYPKTRRFFRRDQQTGEVEYFTFFGAAIVPTTIIGNGALSQDPRPLDSLLLLYADEALVKDLPEAGDKIWFTGTLLGYQHGGSGITRAFGIGGTPYILLQSFSTQAPDTLDVSESSEAAPSR